MTVRAQQDALRGFIPCSLQRPRDPAIGQREALPRRLEMMELQRPDGAVVTADRAGAARLGDQCPLDGAPPAVDCLHPAETTAKAVLAPADEERQTVHRAGRLDRLRTGRTR